MMITPYKLPSIATTFVSTLLFIACAIPSSPTGGSKDNAPPKILLQTPSNGATNFVGKELKIEFDEFVKIEKGGIVISPPIARDQYSISAVRNTIKLKFSEELLDSTTYIVNFGSSIADVNESNKLSDFKVIFSTGNKIDSLSIQGRVDIKHPDLSFEKNTYVILHKDLADSSIVNNEPYYLALVSESGQFTLNHLKKGKYNIFVLKDQNANYQFDLPNEAIGKIEGGITIDSSISDVQLDLYLPDTELKIQEFSNISNGKFVLKFNQSITSESEVIITTSMTDSLIQLFGVDRKELEIWLMTELKTIPEQLQLYVNVDSTLIDTLDLYNVNIEDSTKLSCTLSNAYLVEGDSLVLNFSHPYWDEDDFNFTVKDTGQKVYNWEILSRPGPTQLALAIADIKVKQLYSLSFIYDGDTSKIDLRYSAVEDVGSLLLTVIVATDTLNEEYEPDTVHYLVDVLNKEKELIDRETFRSRKFEYILRRLLPGTYSIYVIEDRNNDGRWNGGDFWKGIAPEGYYLSKDLTVKANWDVEEILTIDFR